MSSFSKIKIKKFLNHISTLSTIQQKKENNWLTCIADLKEKELTGLLQENESTQDLLKQKNILFWTTIPWPNVCLDYILATALRLRGHKVAIILCDGVPICELKRKAHDRPSCSSCYQNALTYVKAFDLPYYPISYFMQDNDLKNVQQVLNDLNTKKLQEFTFEGVTLGKYSIYSVIGYFRYLPDIIEGESLSILKNYIKTGIINCIVSKRSIQELKTDVVITCGGRSPIWAPIFEIAKANSLKCINWENAAVFPKSFVFSDKQPVIHFHIEEDWKKYKDRPLTLEEHNKVNNLFQHWKKGKGRVFDYSDICIEKNNEIKNKLELRDHTPLISIFSNLTWDGTIYGVDSAFENMFDWIFSVIDFAIRHNEFDLVIRTHPVETKLSELLVPMKVGDKIRDRYQVLPENIHIVRGNQISSYTLGQMSDVVMVYVSTIGMELALQGRRPWVVTNAHYGKKGFTVDIKSKEQMYKLLEEREFHNTLTKHEIELVERYIHLLYFRHFVNMPFFQGHQNPIWKIPSFRELLEGENPIIDNLCDCITKDRPFIDIGCK